MGGVAVGIAAGGVPSHFWLLSQWLGKPFRVDTPHRHFVPLPHNFGARSRVFVILSMTLAFSTCFSYIPDNTAYPEVIG